MLRLGKKIIIAAATVAALVIAVTVLGSAPQTLTVKFAPSLVSVDTSALAPKLAQKELNDVWRLFDRDTDSAYRPGNTARVTVNLAEPVTISRIRVHGPASYQLTLYRDNQGAWERIPSLTGVSLTGLSAAWNTLTPSESFTASELMFEFVPQGNVTTGLSEIEIWGADTASENKSSAFWTLRNTKTAQHMVDVLAQSPTQIRDYAATPSEVSVPEGAVSTVTVSLLQNPVLFKRAYLLYEGQNLLRSVSIERRINGQSWAGGFSVPQQEGVSSDWASYLEEINPEWLVQGENRIEFRTKTGDAAVRSLRIVVETDSGWNSVSGITGAEAYDGDTTTAYTVPASSENSVFQISFERAVVAEKLRLHVAGAMNITAALQYQTNGAWQDVKAGWELNFSGLQAGWNEIVLPAPVNTQALRLVFETGSLRIKKGVRVASINEIRVCASPAGPLPTTPRIVISYPRDGEYFGRTAFLQGFAVPSRDQSGNPAWVGIEGKDGQRTVPDGSFSISLTKDDTHFYDQSDDEPWQPVAQSLYDGQIGAMQSVVLNKNSGAQTGEKSPGSENRGNAPFTDNRKHHTEKVSPGQAKKIQYEGVTLDIPAGAVDQDTEITIIPLNEADLAQYDPGMINVTYPAAGYRFLPHGMKFKKAISLSFAYSKQLLSTGQTDDDVNMYYYDEKLLRWQKLSRVKVDAALSQVVSSSDHFTDIINSTLVVPEHAQALSFNPNSIKDIKAADPAANVNLIEAPKANNRGSAGLSYPLEVPPGRNKLQPNLSIQYNSSGGNGWMGVLATR